MVETISLQLKNKIISLPDSPGVYLMKDTNGKIIYVGKAKILTKRVRSYFQNNLKTKKLKRLVQNIEDVEIILTKTETEALLLERNLIKKHQPKFNALLKDDKSFPLIRIDLQAKWPRVEKVRRNLNDGALYLGPFINESHLYRLLSATYKIFPLIRCSEHEFRNTKRPCTYYHMRMCLAPCSLPINPEDYKTMLADVIEFLQGKNTELLTKLESKMLNASNLEAYEQAALYRDQINSLKKRMEKQAVILPGIASADAISLVEDSENFAINLLQVRDENIVGSQNFIFDNIINERSEIIQLFILQYYENRDLPKILYLDCEKTEVDLIKDAINTTKPSKNEFSIKLPKRGQKNDLLELAKKNASHFLKQQLKVKDQEQASLLQLKDELNLQGYPRKIECIDISNFQASEVVGSLVCFKDSKPNKADYRIYNIKTIEDSPNDFASIYEVVKRRLERGVQEDDLPDLLVIDGGKPQLKSALKALTDFPSLELEIIALAKSRVLESQSKTTIRSDERIIKSDFKKNYILKVGSSSYRLLTQLRDEAHRFALKHHRQKRNKKAVSSPLQEIPGVGSKIRQILMDNFGSLQAIENASLEQLLGIKGLPAKTAEQVYIWTRKQNIR